MALKLRRFFNFKDRNHFDGGEDESSSKHCPKIPQFTPLDWCTNYGTLVVSALIGPEVLSVKFFRGESGAEPVRNWLKGLSPQDRKLIGEDIKTVQWGWPLGMPLVRPMGNGLFEIRTHLDNRIARVLFAFKDGKIILLHGFIKKASKTPKQDLDLAKERIKKL